MAFQTGSTTGLKYVKEVTFGVTPVTPQMIAVPYTSTSLDLNIDEIVDDTIVENRMELDMSIGNRHVGGNVVAVHRHNQFDDWVEMALGGTWSANVLKAAGATGGTERSMTVEMAHNTTGDYKVFTGVRVNTWSFAGAINQNVISTFDLIGRDMSLESSPLDASPTAILDKKPFKFLGGSVTIGGVAGKLTSFNFNYTNNMSEDFVITSDVLEQVDWAKASLTGTFTQYLSDFVNYAAYEAGTTMAIVAVMTDGTNTYTINIPRATFSQVTSPIPNSGVLFQNFTFRAGYDTGISSTVSITRSA